jgi:hypothetical protein
VVREKQWRALIAQDKLEDWLKSHSLGQYSRALGMDYDTVGDLLKFDEDQLLTIGRDAGMPHGIALRFKNQLMNLNIPIISAQIAKPGEEYRGNTLLINAPENGAKDLLLTLRDSGGDRKYHVIIPDGAGPGQRLRIDPPDDDAKK